MKNEYWGDNHILHKEHIEMKAAGRFSTQQWLVEMWSNEYNTVEKSNLKMLLRVKSIK